jgi:hypothetical protein
MRNSSSPGRRCTDSCYVYIYSDDFFLCFSFDFFFFFCFLCKGDFSEANSEFPCAVLLMGGIYFCGPVKLGLGSAGPEGGQDLFSL